MGLRFRKSVKLGKGAKLNFSKRSFGVSFGGKGARYSINSSGRRTSSVGIPGTGLSYVHTSGGKKSSSPKRSSGSSTTYAAPKPPMKKSKGMMIVTIFLGFLGIQWFASGRIGMGLLYFFTGGLFGIGWMVDIIRQVAWYLQNKNNEGQE